MEFVLLVLAIWLTIVTIGALYLWPKRSNGHYTYCRCPACSTGNATP